MCDAEVARRVRRLGQAAILLPLLPLMLLVTPLAGCSGTGSATSAVERANDSKLTQETPLDWWHELQGGRIAEGRPPPPGATDPYPNLSQVPAKPTLTDPAVRRALTAQLAAERDRTTRQDVQDPITPLPTAGTPGGAPAATPGRKAAGPPPTAPAAPMATLDAATAPPPTPVASPAPAAQANSRTAPAPAATAPAATASNAPAAPLASGPLPALPIDAPATPQLAGLPAATFAPATPRPAPQTVIAFAQGSAALPDGADPALRDLAALRAGGGVEVFAGGDGGGSPERQEEALPLGLARARAIQGALVAAGVPMAAIHLEASAPGRTGGARLLP